MVKPTPVERAVSPILHPASVPSLAGYEHRKCSLGLVATALDNAYQRMEGFVEVRQKLRLDGSRTPKARVNG